MIETDFLVKSNENQLFWLNLPNGVSLNTTDNETEDDADKGKPSTFTGRHLRFSVVF